MIVCCETLQILAASPVVKTVFIESIRSLNGADAKHAQRRFVYSYPSQQARSISDLKITSSRSLSMAINLALFITGADCIYLPMSVNTYISDQAPLMAHLHFICLFHRNIRPGSLC